MTAPGSSERFRHAAAICVASRPRMARSSMARHAGREVLSLHRLDHLGTRHVGPAAWQELAEARTSANLAVTPYALTTHEGRHRPAGHAHAFIRCVVDGVMEHAVFDGDLLVRIPDRDVGIG